MDGFRNLKLWHRFTLLIGLFALGFIVYGVWSFKTLNEIMVNGPIYQRIVQGKDLIADILPPPEYIIETHLVLKSLQEEADAGQRQSLVKDFERLRKDFDDRHEFWKKELPDDEIKKTLIQDVYGPANTYYKAAADTFIPAVLRGDAKVADEAMAKTLIPSYSAHRKQIDKLVDLVNKKCDAVEKAAATSLHGCLIAILVANLIILGLMTGIGIIIGRAVLNQLGGDPAAVTEIVHRVAAGDLTCSVPVGPGQ